METISVARPREIFPSARFVNEGLFNSTQANRELVWPASSKRPAKCPPIIVGFSSNVIAGSRDYAHRVRHFSFRALYREAVMADAFRCRGKWSFCRINREVYGVPVNGYSGQEVNGTPRWRNRLYSDALRTYSDPVTAGDWKVIDGEVREPASTHLTPDRR